VLSDLEKQRRKEENARRRKLQMDQKMENDRVGSMSANNPAILKSLTPVAPQNDVINRLLKAQTGKTRRNAAQNEGTPMSGLDGDDPMNGGSSDTRNSQVVPGMLRFVSSIKSGKFEMLVSAPPGKEKVIEFASAPRTGQVAGGKKAEARCAVKGCGEKRKYRSVLNFETGGCSMSHLKLVEQSLRRT
jgi:Ino eighty subunit 2